MQFAWWALRWNGKLKIKLGRILWKVISLMNSNIHSCHWTAMKGGQTRMKFHPLSDVGWKPFVATINSDLMVLNAKLSA